jgi:hypothetical protein
MEKKIQDFQDDANIHSFVKLFDSVLESDPIQIKTEKLILFYELLTLLQNLICNFSQSILE